MCPRALRQPLAVPPAFPPSPPSIPAPIAVVPVMLRLAVSSRIEQTERDEQQQGLFLLWGRAPVSGAQFLLRLSLALPFSLCLWFSPPAREEQKSSVSRGMTKWMLPFPSSSAFLPGCCCREG